MKKLLAVLLIVGIASIASASTCPITLDPVSFEAAAGDTVRVTVSNTHDKALLGADVVLSVIAGNGVIVGASGKADAAALGWDAGFTLDPTITPASAEVGLGNFNGNSAGVIAFFDVQVTDFAAGDIVVELTNGQGKGGTMDAGFGAVGACGTATITPEPMTMTLLGLGGLALIRRRRA